jgi:hypothetical protein
MGKILEKIYRREWHVAIEFALVSISAFVGVEAEAESFELTAPRPKYFPENSVAVPGNYAVGLESSDVDPENFVVG